MLRRLQAEIAVQSGAGTANIPDRKTLAASTTQLLKAISTEVPEQGREMAQAMAPIVLTPKKEGPGRFWATGSLDLAPLAAGGASGSSGGAQRGLYDVYSLDFEAEFAA